MCEKDSGMCHFVCLRFEVVSLCGQRFTDMNILQKAITLHSY